MKEGDIGHLLCLTVETFSTKMELKNLIFICRWEPLSYKEIVTKKMIQGLILHKFLSNEMNSIVYQQREPLNPYVRTTKLKAWVSNEDTTNLKDKVSNACFLQRCYILNVN